MTLKEAIIATLEKKTSRNIKRIKSESCQLFVPFFRKNIRAMFCPVFNLINKTYYPAYRTS
jgi:hypothetical protein